MSVGDHVTISHSQAVEAGAQVLAITCSRCGSTFRVLLPVSINDLAEVTRLMIEAHRHDGSEEDDE